MSENLVLIHSGRKGMKWYQHIFGDDNIISARKKKREEAKQHYLENEKQQLVQQAKKISDTKGFKGYAKPGNYITASGAPIYNPTKRSANLAAYIIDHNGDVKVAYLEGKYGSHLVTVGKQYVDKMDLSKYFRDINFDIVDYDAIK